MGSKRNRGPSDELISSVRKGDLLGMKAALADGADADSLDAKGCPALLIAAKTGSVGCARLLVEAGCAREALCKERAETALIAAARLGRQEMLLWLIGRGCDIEALDGQGNCALHVALEKGHARCAEILIDGGCDVDRTRSGGRTALMSCKEYGMDELARKLIAAGADLEVRDMNGDTALIHAARCYRLSFAEILLEAGADPMASNILGATAKTYAGGPMLICIAAAQERAVLDKTLGSVGAEGKGRRL